MNFFKSKYYYKFSRNPLSVFGLIIVCTVILLAIFAPYITPFPEHVGPFTDFANKSKPPSSTYIFGTDKIKRKRIYVSDLGDHRICMSSAVLSLVTACPIHIRGFETVNTSSPSFLKTIKTLGGKFEIKKKS